MSKYFYGVKVGRKTGIYKTWSECEEQVKGFPGAKYKKFSSQKEATDFVNDIESAIPISEDREITSIHEEDLRAGEAIAYVDGSFDLSNHTYSYGVVFITEDDIENYSGREQDEELAQMRNVAGELKGAMIAMELALEKGMETLYLHYDYTGIEEWAKGNWKTNKEGTRSYREYYESIKDKLEVKFVKVKAHSGIKYNEEADKLAREAILG